MSEIKLYRQKPVIVSAIRWDGTPENTALIMKTYHKHVKYVPARMSGDDPPVKLPAHLTITNTYWSDDGLHKSSHIQVVRKGDFVVQLQEDVLSSVTPEVFNDNYEEYDE